MKIFIKVATAIALFATSLVALAEVSGQLGIKSSHVIRGVELGNEASTYGAIQFDMAGISFGVSAVDSSADGGQDDVTGASSAADDFTETTYDMGYNAKFGYLDVSLGYLQRELNYSSSTDRDTAEFSAALDLSGISLTYTDGDIKNDPSNFEEILLGYSVGNTQFNLGDVTISGAGSEASYKYYEITSGTEVWGLDLTATLTGIVSTDGLVDQKSSLVIGLSKSLNL